MENETGGLTPQGVQAFAGYQRWMNGRVYARCANLSDAERKADRGAFFRSIHGTLNHLLYGDLNWFGRFKDGRSRAEDRNALLHERFEDMRAARVALDAEMKDWAESLSQAWLDAPFDYRSSAGAARRYPAWMLVLHMFNHQTHHRGQLTTLMTQAGLDVGDTDLTLLPALDDIAPGIIVR
jgi:uncharacterized damage-inducible protein DinB